MMKSTPKLSFGTILQEGQRVKIQVKCKSYKELRGWVCGCVGSPSTPSVNQLIPPTCCWCRSILASIQRSGLDSEHWNSIQMAVVGVSHLFLSHTVYIVYIYTQLIENSISSWLGGWFVKEILIPCPILWLTQQTSTCWTNGWGRDPGNRETLTFDEGCSNPFFRHVWYTPVN